MTVDELHKRFELAKRLGEVLEYECIYEEVTCVRHTELGYCELIDEETAAGFVEAFGEDRFYEIEREDGTPLSAHYRYYLCEYGKEEYYAVKIEEET